MSSPFAVTPTSPVPCFRRVKVIHVGDDLPALAESFENEDDKLACYRRVPDEIRAFVETLPEALSKIGDTPMKNDEQDALRDSVRSRYAEVARAAAVVAARTALLYARHHEPP